jgi:replication factor C subunit 1
LTKEDWDALVELILKSDEQLKQIPSAAKSAFTRTYNKSSHTVPFAIQDLKKLKATSTAEQNVALDGEEIVGKESAIDDNEEEEQNDDGADRMVVAKNTKAKGKGKAAASGSKSGRGRGGSSKASTSRAGSSRGRGKSKK